MAVMETMYFKTTAKMVIKTSAMEHKLQLMYEWFFNRASEITSLRCELKSPRCELEQRGILQSSESSSNCPHAP
jgi:hypothetical protein